MKILLLPFNIFLDIIKSLANPDTRRSSLILLGSLFGSCMLCYGAFSVLGGTEPKTTPTPALSEQDIIDNAVRGITDVLEQTSSALPPLTTTPTDTPSPTLVSTISPTNTFLPTSTIPPLPTATIVIVIPTQPPAQTGCSCNGDTYNCSDFGSYSQAQSCYDTCVAQGRGDIHRLDSDGDGIACESLR